MKEKKEEKNSFNDFTKRFMEVVDAIGTQDFVLAKEVKRTQQYISQMRNGECGVPEGIMVNFLERYPNVNANYIMTGRGAMSIDGSIRKKQEYDDCTDLIEECKELLSKVEKKDARIVMLTSKLIER